MPKPSLSYRDLAAWQLGMELAESIYAGTERLPADERFGLRAQIRGAAVSVPSNIAEGQKRGSPNDFIYRLGIAAGSIAEVETLLELCARLRMLTPDAAAPLIDLASRVGRLISGLRTALKTRLRKDPRHDRRP